MRRSVSPSPVKSSNAIDVAVYCIAPPRLKLFPLNAWSNHPAVRVTYLYLTPLQKVWSKARKEGGRSGACGGCVAQLLLSCVVKLPQRRQSCAERYEKWCSPADWWRFFAAERRSSGGRKPRRAQPREHQNCLAEQGRRHRYWRARNSHRACTAQRPQPTINSVNAFFSHTIRTLVTEKTVVIALAFLN